MIKKLKHMAIALIALLSTVPSAYAISDADVESAIAASRSRRPIFIPLLICMP